LKRVRLRHRAKRELREAIAWYGERSEAVAKRFAAEVRQALEHLEQFPSTGAFVPSLADPDVRRLPIHNFPYHIVFVRLADHISVLAVAHDRRRPGYWVDNN
jgi:plasmid stabilization system protein ParE